jgi:hypothetical protein
MLALALMVGGAASAAASVFNFSYSTSAGVIEAELQGALQPDNNTFIVSSVSSVTLGGTPAPAFTFVYSADVIIFGAPVGLSGSVAALVTLDASAMDIAICMDVACIDGFIIATGGEIGAVYGPIVYASAEAGDIFEPFTSGRDTFTAETDGASIAVPAPGGVALFGLALLGLGMAARRRA